MGSQQESMRVQGAQLNVSPAEESEFGSRYVRVPFCIERARAGCVYILPRSNELIGGEPRIIVTSNSTEDALLFAAITEVTDEQFSELIGVVAEQGIEDERKRAARLVKSPLALNRVG